MLFIKDVGTPLLKKSSLDAGNRASNPPASNFPCWDKLEEKDYRRANLVFSDSLSDLQAWAWDRN